MSLIAALDDVEIGFRQLEFAIKLLSFCESGKIDPSEFDTDHVVLLEEGRPDFPIGHFRDVDNITQAARICVLITFSASVLVLDKALEIAGVQSDPEATDNLKRLRALIYMIRCAQAHGIADPRWEVLKNRYLRVLDLDIEGVPLTIDLRGLHGKPFQIDQIGGYFGWHQIRRYVVAALSRMV